MARLELWYHAACSKSRRARELLEGRGHDPVLFEYQRTPPDRTRLLALLRALGQEDPLCIVRTKDALFGELGLDGADAHTLLDALLAHPELIERPILVHGERAVVARPPERVFELLDAEPGAAPL